ncbi:tRNA-intron endonuclease [Phytophthora nicotianae]|uniref:tRNA-intron lyase n=1 Tax=Phytophthora nicotianae TaxID=4792 RepID=W2KK24_PHYNI|nr:tRNA-intron endonuclease [Phytophthora nicotianae]
MVTWQVLGNGLETEVTFEAEDNEARKDFQKKGLGITALSTSPVSLETVGKESNELVTSGNDTMETKRRRHLSLPETYYAVINGLLPIDEPLRELWERFNSLSVAFVRNFIVYQHFRHLDWIPKSGLNYGVHYVLYRGSATEFHSEYIVYVQDEASSWNTIQSLTRIAADVKKTVLLCTVTAEITGSEDSPADLTFGVYSFHDVQYTVEAIAIRFWDPSIADGPQSYTFQQQPVLPKKPKTVKKKNRAKRPKHQLEETLTTSGNSA